MLFFFFFNVPFLFLPDLEIQAIGMTHSLALLALRGGSLCGASSIWLDPRNLVFVGFPDAQCLGFMGRGSLCPQP